MLIFAQMNVIDLCLIGIAVVLLITPLQNLTQKTADWFRRIQKLNQISKLLNDVTLAIRKSKLDASEFKGVARGIVSPINVPRLGPGVRYSKISPQKGEKDPGATISFIITNANPDLLSITYGEKRILIWRKQKGKKIVWYFYDESRVTTVLSGKSAEKSEQLFELAWTRHRHLNATSEFCAEEIIKTLRIRRRKMLGVDLEVA